MAIYVEIVKVDETDANAEYSFGVSPGTVGRLSLDKANGSVRVVEALPDDADSRYAARARQKLLQHWRKGEIPDRTCWAS